MIHTPPFLDKGVKCSIEAISQYSDFLKVSTLDKKKWKQWNFDGANLIYLIQGIEIPSSSYKSKFSDGKETYNPNHIRTI